MDNEISIMENTYGAVAGTADSSVGDAETVAESDAEIRHRLEKDIVKVFHLIIKYGTDCGRCWRGSMTDLLSLAHIAWLNDLYFDERGQIMTFTELSRRLCVALRRTPVAKPNFFVCKDARRKGIKALPVMDRYVRLVRDCHLRNPLFLDLVYV